MFPLTVSFRGLRHSAALTSLVRSQATVLERLFPRILECRVVIERPHRHRRTGVPIHVRIDVHVPGREIVTEHQPTLHAELTHAEAGHFTKSTQIDTPLRDARLAVREAFRTAARRIQDNVTRNIDTHHAARGRS